MRYFLVGMFSLFFSSALVSTYGNSSIKEGFKSKEDSLLYLIKNTANDTTKATHYILLSDINTYNNSSKAIEYAENAITVSKKVEYHTGIAKGYERAGNAYFQLGKNKLAAEQYLKAGEANKKANNYQLDASVNYNLGNIQHELGNYDSAIYYAKEAGRIFIENNDSIGYGVSLYMISSENQSKGNYDVATYSILKALDIFRSKGVREWEVYALNMLVTIYNVQEKYDESLEILKTCINYHREINNAKFMAITYRLIGDIHMELLAYNKARTALDSSYQITADNGFIQEKIKSLYSLGQLEFKTKQFDKALELYNAGLKLSFELDDELFKCSNFLGIGECLSELKKYKEANSSLNKSIEHGLKLEDYYKLKDAHKVLSDNYETLNDYPKALTNYKSYKQYSDSISAQENKRQFAELTSKYETEKKEKQIHVLQEEKAKVQSNNQRVLFFWILTLVVGALVVSILIIAYRKNRLLLQAEKELDQVKSRFFANISHEFRTPLTLILGPISDMLKQKESEPFHPILQSIKHQANRLLLLINQILDLSKLDSGKYKLNIKKDDFVAMFKNTVLSFHSLAETKDIKLEIECDKDSWLINYDTENSKTILNNILSNAFKYEPEGGVIQVILDSSFTNQKNRLKVSVTNKGSFISKEECNLIFDRFYGSANSFANGKGTGIGLALTKELVELHKGSIEVESSKDTGTCFSFYIPIDLPLSNNNVSVSKSDVSDLDDETITIEQTKQPETSIPNSSPLVLVIEDHQEVLNYIVSILGTDYQIKTANNGKKGVEKALAEIPDIIISDVMMPELNGIEATKLLKSNELTAHIPIILLTAKASEEDRLEGLEVKADAYISKPFNADELKLKLKNLLEHRNKLREKYSQELFIQPANLNVKSLDQVFMEKICQAIEDNLSNEDFSVEELSNIIGLSRSQLHRKLEAVTSKSTSRFIREYKLERAKELILINTGTISEIAYMTGFKNIGYFNKSFKTYFNITPGQHSRQAKIL